KLLALRATVGGDLGGRAGKRRNPIMKRFFLVLALPLSACVAAPAETDTGSTEQAMSLSKTTRIDFDVDPNGAAIADGTVVDNVYASLGVHFSAIYCGNT